MVGNIGVITLSREIKMKCKNQHCKSSNFVAVLEMDNNRLIGIKCMSCGARYQMDDIEVKKTVKRPYWNSVKWKLGELK